VHDVGRGGGLGVGEEVQPSSDQEARHEGAPLCVCTYVCMCVRYCACAFL